MHLVAAVGILVGWASPAVCQAKAGDRTTISVESTMDVEIMVRDGSGAGEIKKLLNLLRRETFEQEALAVTDGMVSSARIKVLSSTLQKSGSDTRLEENPTALADQTYTSTRGTWGWAAVDSDGGAAPAEGATLGAWNDAGWLVPKEGPKAGAQWDVEAAKLAALISPAGLREASGKITCTCRGVEGSRASIVFAGSLSGKGARDDTQIKVTIKAGILEYDLAKGRPVMVSLSGSYDSILSIEDVSRKPNENVEERQKIGEIQVRSRKLEAKFDFK
jgi:hypothetical protein